MRFTALFMLLACLMASATGFAQKLTLDEKNANAAAVFSKITKQTGYTFTYAEELLASKKITIKVKDETLNDVLKKIFSQLELGYSIVDKTIVVKEKVVNVAPFNIHGRVVDKSGEPVAGAALTVKGSLKGTTTDAGGYFELSDIDENATLLVNGVSIEASEVRVEEKRELVIVVATKVESMNEVVINKGYYSESRRLSTGSISKITAKEIERQPINNPLSALQGRMPGIDINQATGVPGGGFTVRIRGINSLRNTINDNGNEPFYIIDGVPYLANSLSNQTISTTAIGPLGTNPLSYINPADILSIEILKDADATAIYGSRGANGVILITTKKGQSGKTKADINIYHGLGKVTRKMNLMNSRQFLDMRYEAFRNDNIDFTNSTVNVPDLKAWDTTRNTDWQKELIGGITYLSNAKISIIGGNESTNFRIGGGYLKEGSVFNEMFADRKISADLGVFHKSLNNKFTATISVNYINDLNTLPNTDLTTQALRLPPTAPALYTIDGKLNWQNSTWTNPVSLFFKKYEANANNLISSANLGYSFLENFHTRINLGFTSTSLKEISTNPQESQNPATFTQSSAQFANSTSISWIVEPQMEYTQKYDKHKFDFLVGSSFQQNTSEMLRQIGSGYTSDELIQNIHAATTITKGSYDKKLYRYSGFFGRFNYSFFDKYLINLTGRRDGSSRFGPGKQFANFWAIGGAWIFSSENFARTFLKTVNFGKLRASYGTTGNDQLIDYKYLDTYEPTSNSYLGGGLFPTSLYNPDFRWEINKKFDIELVLGFLNNRIYFSSNYYNNRSSNQLVGYPLAPTAGFPSVQYNLPATIRNSGLEFELRTTNISNKQFKWESSLNITVPKNKLLSYPGIENSSYANQYIIGEPLSIVMLYNLIGIDNNGLYLFEDYNKDGVITAAADKKAFRNTGKIFYGGLVNNFQFHSFEINFLFQFVKQSGRNYLGVFTMPGFTFNEPIFVLEDRWKSPGDKNARLQRFSQNTSLPITQYSNYTQSTSAYTDASYIRLKNISLAYQFPKKVLSRIKMESCRIYFMGQNLLTLTNYKGLDPENNSFTALPPIKMFTVGLQFSL